MISKTTPKVGASACHRVSNCHRVFAGSLITHPFRRLRGYCAVLAALLLLLAPTAQAANVLSGSSAAAPATVDLTALGETDWAHWGFDQTGDLNRKVDGGALISDFTLGGGATMLRKTTASGYVWSNGAPQVQVVLPRRKGVRNVVVGGSFTFSVPASTDPATLRVFVGARGIDATLNASLSDGSAAPVNIAVSAGGGRSTVQAEFVFSADAPGTTLDITYTLDAITGSTPEHFLEAATLSGGSAPGNQPPELAALNDVTVTEGDDFVLMLSATDPDHATGLVFSQTNTLPGDAPVLTDMGDGTATLSWTSSIGDSANSPYEITVLVEDPEGAEDSQTVAVTVLQEGGSGGQLSGSSSLAPATVDLTVLGVTDWVHWGFDQAGDVNRKVGGGALISDFTLGGGASVIRKTTASGYVWMDGAPQDQVLLPRRKGVRNVVVGGSFSLSIPAASEPSTLLLFVGARDIDATISATLSDASATPVELNISAGGGRTTHQAEFVFASDTPGATLDIVYTLDATTGGTVEHFLEAAALSFGGGTPNLPPVLASIGDVTVVEGEDILLNLSATDADHSTGLVFSQTNTLPGDPPVLNDMGDGTATLTWSSSPGDFVNSPYEIDVVVSDPENAEDMQTVTVNVLQEGGSSGALSGSSAVSEEQIDLTALGLTDWAHWGFSSGAPFVTKAAGSGEIGDVTGQTGSNVQRFTNGIAKFSWSDGDVVPSATDTRTSLRVRSVGEGMTFSVAADTQPRSLVVYVGARRAVGRLVATLSDGSAAPITVDVVAPLGKSSFAIALNYQAATAGAMLDITYTLDSQPNSGSSWVSIESATLAVDSSFALPFNDDFSNGAQDWLVTDEAIGATSDWLAQNNRYEQLNFMGFTADAMQGAMQVGTLSYLDGAASLTDYRFSVTVQPLEGTTQGFSQDLGALVRYNPATGEQIRLSFSGANAFSRLERRSALGVATLAQNSVGFNSDAARTVELTVQGGVVVAVVDGEPMFAGYDDELMAGTVGLYCRNACAFDDVAIEPVAPGAMVVVAQPEANSVQTTTSFAVSAVVLNPEAGATVVFDIPGETSPCSVATETAPGLFEATCDVSGTGTYSVIADYLDDQDALLATDERLNVGVGDYYAALGNSITAGLDDPTASDAVSMNGFVVGTQGFEALLSDRLTTSTNPVVVSNNGVPGDTSTDLINDRVDGVLERHAGASHLLLTIGVNEAGGGMFLPSGLGCTGSACDGTFKGNVQGIVDATLAAGITPVVSLTPPRFGDPFQTPYTSPASHERNILIRDEYNVVIETELTGATLGPDLFRVFLGPENRFYLYATNLHPNALGYAAMAAEFEAALTGNPQTVYYATDFCVRLNQTSNCQKPLLYKQNLMEVGDELFVDNTRRLTGSVPAALDNGRWIQTAHTDRNRSNTNYLKFEVPTTSTMYVAYDAAATSLPAWLSSGFTATGMSITTSGVIGSELTLYEQTNVLGTVELGGAAANQHGSAINYLVILVED